MQGATRPFGENLRAKVIKAMAKAKARRERFFRLFPGVTDEDYEVIVDNHYTRKTKNAR